MSGSMETPRDQFAEHQLYIERTPGVLRKMAEPHVDASGGRMVHLDFDPAIYPGQDPDCFHIRGTPQSIENTDLAGEVAQPHYRAVRDALCIKEGTTALIQEAGKWLEAGNNIAVITRHDDLTDIAFALKMTTDYLHYQGYSPESVAIMVSKMVAAIGHVFTFDGVTHQTVPAISTLGLFCTDIYESWQQTDSAKSVFGELPHSCTSGLNRRLMKTINEQLDKGGVVIGIAPTGTTQVGRTETGELALASLSDGTVGLLMHPNTRTVSMLLDYEAETPYATYCSDLVNIDSVEKAKAVMNHLAAAHLKGLGGTAIKG